MCVCVCVCCVNTCPSCRINDYCILVLRTGHPDIKLVNGIDRCSGRVEVQNDGQWGTVCDDSWDIRDAQVACRAMDCGTPLLIKPAAYYGPGRGNVWLDDLECFGNETSLMQCKHKPFGRSHCNHMQDAAVQCSSECPDL